jgi:predicted metal-dependent peptidase
MPRTAAKPVNGDEIVARAAISLFLMEPFFSHVITGGKRRIDESTPTAAVAVTDSGVELRANPTFLASLPEKQRVGVLKHEILHLVLKHLTRTKGRNPFLWNLACDVVVNELVAPWPLPDGAIRRSSFPHLDIPAKATAEEVYDLLATVPTGQVQPCVAKLEATDAGGADAGGADAGAEGDRERGHGGPDEGAPGGNPQAVGGHSDHSGWADRTGAAALTDEQIRISEIVIDDLLVRSADRSARTWGTLPAFIRTAITQARERNKPKVDWRRSLRIFSAGSGRTRLVTTSRRESPRYGRNSLPGAGHDPRTPTAQRLVPGNRVKRLHSLLVAVDTSGSIDDPTLTLFFNEIDAIWRLGAAVTVVTCDAAVQTSFVYEGAHSIRVGGGGGTSFDPVFRWAQEQRGRRFDGIIYLTDGFAAEPVVRPATRVLWVVTHPEGMGEHLWFGQQIHLDPQAP